MSLYKRITETGTLSEPNGVPNPIFALPSTVNWMRGLALRVSNQGIDSESSKSFYSSVSKRNASEHEINTILEQLLFALHQCSALHALRQVPRKADVARVGIVSWYYGVYAAASAMVAAKDGSFQDDHTTTAVVWDRQISESGLIAHPFDFRVTTLVKKDADEELRTLLTTDRFDLARQPPQSFDEAYGACHAYLSGSVNWWRWKTEEDLKSSRDFKELNVSDFRSKVARELRDRRFNNKTVGFLHQAFRYRGKANYREALFLGFGANTETILNNYIDDLSEVLNAFVCQAGIFCSRRLGKTIWNEFLADLESGRAFSLSPTYIWGTNG
jgi:hypothetical protein